MFGTRSKIRRPKHVSQDAHSRYVVRVGRGDLLTLPGHIGRFLPFVHIISAYEKVRMRLHVLHMGKKVYHEWNHNISVVPVS